MKSIEKDRIARNSMNSLSKFTMETNKQKSKQVSSQCKQVYILAL